MSKTHYLRVDYRVESLTTIVNGLENAINKLKKQIKDVDWYDVDWCLEEIEPIYGLSFIAFQNYINGSIKDFIGELNDSKHQLYKLGNNKENSKSMIELIIALANYSKHKEEGTPHKGTKDILDYFQLTYENVTYLDKSAIFEGLTLLDSSWDLLNIMKIVTEWRELLWNQEVKFNI